jgi:3-phenylpropionate/cinnamic acid dioxygenase small subunit
MTASRISIAAVYEAVAPDFPSVDDAAAITALLMAYAEHLDGGDFDAVAALFAGATFGRPGEPGRRGRDEVRAMYDAVVLYDDGTPRTRHLITNVVVHVAADRQTATSRCAFTVLQAVAASDAIVTILAGRYHDRFARDADGGCHFVERVVHPDLQGDLSRHYRRPS